MRPSFRLIASAAGLSTWLILLFTGWTLGGLIHLLLVGAVVAFPWRDSKIAGGIDEGS